MPRPKDSKNKATIVREYLHKKFADLAESKDIDEMLLSLIDKAKEGNIMASRIILDNMDKIVQWEQKQEEGSGGVEIFINRDGIEVSVGKRGLIDGMGSHNARERQDIPEYKDYVGPLPNWGIGGGEKSREAGFQPEKLYKWGDCVMSLGDICREEGVNYGRVYGLMDRHNLPIEDAVQEIKELTDHPDNEVYNG